MQAGRRALVGHVLPLPPLWIGSDIIGLRCLFCARAFARGDVIRVSISVAVDGAAVQTAYVHRCCEHPRGCSMSPED